MPNERFPLRLFIYLCLAFIGSALCSTAHAVTACVWRVTSAPVPFYLVGTIHELSGTDYPLPKAYNEALRDSKRLIFEMTPDIKSDFPKKFARAAAYPKGDAIQRHVHGKTWEALARAYRGSNYFGKAFRLGDYYLEGIEQLRPWAVAYMVWGIRGYNDVFSSHGVDNHLAYQGRRLRKELAGLETDDEHLDVLRGLTDVESELILLDALIRGDKRRDDYNLIRSAWKRGDTAAIWAQNQRFRNLNPGADVRLLDERNVRWIPRIKAEMKTGVPTSIVVGAGHFLGPNGVVELLKRGGYKIEQL